VNREEKSRRITGVAMLIANTSVGPSYRYPLENPRTAIRAKEWTAVGSKAKQRILDMATAKE